MPRYKTRTKRRSRAQRWLGGTGSIG